jgi:CHASE2 domain-containing sensor protein
MPPLAQNASINPSRRSSLVWSFAIIAALVVLKTLSENTQVAKHVERKTYELLQRRIVAGGTTIRPDVLVVDLAKIKREPWERNGRSGVATPRAPLKQLVEVFADLGARSVGVDLDFSPKGGQFMHPDDADFFNWCLKLSDEKGIPILLGVYRTYKDPYKWLGDDRYMRLAAAITSRTVDHGLATHWIAVKKGRAPLPSMSAALAGEDVSLASRENSLWSWAVGSTWIVQLAPDLWTAESVIDFAPLQRIREDVLPTLNPESFRELKDKIKNRMILLGDAQPEAGDLFNVPGVTGAVPGVFLHACAANTIANEPLYSLTLPGRIAIDMILAIVIFVLVKFSHWLLLRFERDLAHAEHKLDVIFTFVTIVLVLITSVVFVRETRLLWTDFLLVCAVLLVQLVVDIIRSRSTFSPANSNSNKNPAV